MRLEDCLSSVEGIINNANWPQLAEKTVNDKRKLAEILSDIRELILQLAIDRLKSKRVKYPSYTEHEERLRWRGNKIYCTPVAPSRHLYHQLNKQIDLSIFDTAQPRSFLRTTGASKARRYFEYAPSNPTQLPKTNDTTFATLSKYSFYKEAIFVCIDYEDICRKFFDIISKIGLSFFDVRETYYRQEAQGIAHKSKEYNISAILAGDRGEINKKEAANRQSSHTKPQKEWWECCLRLLLACECVLLQMSCPCWDSEHK